MITAVVAFCSMIAASIAAMRDIGNGVLTIESERTTDANMAAGEQNVRSPLKSPQRWLWRLTDIDKGAKL